MLTSLPWSLPAISSPANRRQIRIHTVTAYSSAAICGNRNRNKWSSQQRCVLLASRRTSTERHRIHTRSRLISTTVAVRQGSSWASRQGQSASVWVEHVVSSSAFPSAGRVCGGTLSRPVSVVAVRTGLQTACPEVRRPLADPSWPHRAGRWPRCPVGLCGSRAGYLIVPLACRTRIGSSSPDHRRRVGLLLGAPGAGRGRVLTRRSGVLLVGGVSAAARRSAPMTGSR